MSARPQALKKRCMLRKKSGQLAKAEDFAYVFSKRSSVVKMRFRMPVRKATKSLIRTPAAREDVCHAKLQRRQAC